MSTTTVADLDGSGVDALQDLGDEIATLAAHVHAATHRLLTLIREFDRRRGWELEGGRRGDRFICARARLGR